MVQKLMVRRKRAKAGRAALIVLTPSSPPESTPTPLETDGQATKLARMRRVVWNKYERRHDKRRTTTNEWFRRCRVMNTERRVFLRCVVIKEMRGQAVPEAGPNHPAKPPPGNEKRQSSPPLQRP